MKLSEFLGDLNALSEKIVFESRWMLQPFNFGLMVALAVYLIRYLMDDYYFVTHGFTLQTEEILVLLLNLVDMYMVANLIVMIVKGSYQIFIHKFNVPAEDREGWLDHIDTGLLKVKTSQSIASITGVALLKDFVNLDKIEWNVAVHRLIIHGVCLVSALVMSGIWRITHVEEKPHHEHN
jgi:uncharacterized protein (TIGR00645 family)